MKATMRQVLEVRTALQTLCAGTRFPAKTAYWLGKLKKAVDAEARDYEEAQNECVKKHGEPLEGGMRYRLVPSKLEAYNKELEDLLKEEVDFGDKVHPIKWGEIEHVDLPPDALSVLIESPFMEGAPA